jgi:UDP-glucose 4-epimerase
MRLFEGIEVLNLGTGRGVSVKEIIETFIRVNGVNVKTEIGERRKGDVAVCYCNPEKARRVLNWKAELTLEDMCKDSWNYYQNLN